MLPRSRLALIRQTETARSLWFSRSSSAQNFPSDTLCSILFSGRYVDSNPLTQFPNYLVLKFRPPALKKTFEVRVAPLWDKIHSNATIRHPANLRNTLLPELLKRGAEAGGDGWLCEEHPHL